MFAAGKRFMQQRCASHGGAVLHSISVHADRAAGKQNLSSMCFAVALPQKTIKKNAL
jgi:hypothetical protein